MTMENARFHFGRFSVPFFFEPGENCVAKVHQRKTEGVKYGDHVRAKTKACVEFQLKTGMRKNWQTSLVACFRLLMRSCQLRVSSAPFEDFRIDS